MILLASFIGCWEKLELWDHTHLALLALLIMVCVLEAILLKITTSAGLFTRLYHYDPDDTGEYEEDIYYEELSVNYDHHDQRIRRYRYRHAEEEGQTMRHQHQLFNNHNNYSDANDHIFNNNNNNNNSNSNSNHRNSTTTNVFRFVY